MSALLLFHSLWLNAIVLLNYHFSRGVMDKCTNTCLPNLSKLKEDLCKIDTCLALIIIHYYVLCYVTI